MSDQTPFVPSPGRIVLVRCRDGDVYPAIVNKAWGERVRVTLFTNHEVEPVEVDTFDRADLADPSSVGWFRPSDWPQPTESK